ncbi:hypothetical protein P3X46_001490 [Hevea brasiliensis]|uniref:F-box domain-containing protein n=1 Tax=Hevea brasiliensis TaxID=3981 RepID=A0ABQ9NGY5_HEVBR|nr:hypothetical protein P3X46_001490 [Hevea brasiliensis]
MDATVSDSPQELNIERIDRISELPESIIHHIYSFLPTKDTAITTLLSKSWGSKWASYPNLDLDQSLFGKELEIFGFHRENPTENRQKRVRKEKFIKFICVQKFKLYISIHELKHISLVKKWIRLAMKRSVREVKVHTPMPPFLIRIHTLPQEIFACKSVTVLKLCCCDLRGLLYKAKGAIKLPSLHNLSLNQVFVDEFTVKVLLLSCPLIARFCFRNCKGDFNDLFVAGLENLKILKLIMPKSGFEELERVTIVAPSLQSLTISGDAVMIKAHKSQELKSLTLKGVDMVTDELFHNLMSEHPLLETLQLDHYMVTDELFHNLMSEHPLFETLQLDHCKMLERIKISSHRLKSLTIRDCLYLEHCEIVTPNLLSFEYDGNLSAFCGGFIYAPCQWKVKLELDCDILWLCDLESLVQGKRFKDLTLSISSEEISSYYDDDEKKPLAISPCCEVEHLSLGTDASQSSYKAIIEGLFSICQPKILSVASTIKSANKFIRDVKIERVKRAKEDDPQCLALLKQRPLQWDTLLNALPKLGGGHVYFALNWSTQALYQS